MTAIPVRPTAMEHSVAWWETTSAEATHALGKVLGEACAGGESEGKGDTRLLIQPGHVFRSVDVLLTNFHLPRSTLLALVCAFGGRERVLDAYAIAVREGYRFYSYGDAMLLFP